MTGSWSTPEPFLIPEQRGYFLGLLHLPTLLFSLIPLLNKKPQSQAPRSLSKPGMFPSSPGTMSHCPQSFPAYNACPDLAVPLSSLSSKVRKVLMKLQLNVCTGQASCGFVGMVLDIFRDQFFRDFIVNCHPHSTPVHLPYHTKHKLLSHELLNCQILRKHQEKKWDEGIDFQSLWKKGWKIQPSHLFIVENFSSFKGKI